MDGEVVEVQGKRLVPYRASLRPMEPSNPLLPLNPALLPNLHHPSDHPRLHRTLLGASSPHPAPHYLSRIPPPSRQPLPFSHHHNPVSEVRSSDPRHLPPQSHQVQLIVHLRPYRNPPGPYQDTLSARPSAGRASRVQVRASRCSMWTI